MSKLYRVLLCAFLAFTFCFSAFGYAALTDTVTIFGTAAAEGKPYKGVYITAVEQVRSSGVNISDCSFSHPTNHKTTVDSTQNGGWVTYKVTVFNNDDLTYWYVGPRYLPEYGNNSLLGSYGGVTIVTKDHISDSSGTFDNNDWIPPQTERDFYVTYKYDSNAQAVTELMINFHFDIRLDAVHDEFVSILNNVFSPTSYDDFSEIFDQLYIESSKTAITTESHPDVFAKYFPDLMVNIDGTEKKASVVIRRENLDGDVTSGDDYSTGPHKGCEYTLYITVEPLTPGTNPTVYAIAYSCGADGMGDDWYQVGELYEGTAPVNSDGTINYSKWVATEKTYEIADGIEYKVAAPNGDQYDIMKTIEQLISAEDQDVFNQIDNTNIFKKTYNIIQKHKGSSDPAVTGLRKAFEDASIFYNNLNNGQEFKVVRNKYTRAEIIHALKNIQAALDYYYQAFPG